VVTIHDCGDPRVLSEIIEAMLDRLADAFAINEHALHLGGSAGIAVAPADGSDVEELIANADLALYRAKADGGRTYRFFEPVFRAQAQARRTLDLDLRRAFGADEFEIYFQPQIRLADKKVIGAEALLRWNHPKAGVVAPGAFIETLTASLIAQEVGRWIIHDACRQAASWRANGLHLDRIAVNLFPSQLRGGRLFSDVQDALRASGLPPEALELEITENVALDQDAGMKLLQRLHAEGIALAFDDFGTGYASLSNLTRFPLRRVKIDRSFVRKITETPQDSAIVRSLIAMAHNLGLSVTAEGVETTAQAAFLTAENCEEAQGFLYGKPVRAAEFEQFLRVDFLAPSEHRSAG
jgi:EAL domain-containing protein (putative c-di-GMP-specific phosphodiesterase class I)